MVETLTSGHSLGKVLSKPVESILTQMWWLSEGILYVPNPRPSRPSIDGY